MHELRRNVQASVMSRGGRFKRTLKIASELADILIRIRDKPKLLDWIAVGVRLTDVGLRVRDELRMGGINPIEHFLNPREEWVLVQRPFVLLMANKITDRKQVTLPQGEGFPVAWEGRYAGVRVGWIGQAEGKQFEQTFVWKNDADALRTALREETWRMAGGKHVVLSPSGIIADPMPEGRVMSTELVELLNERVPLFLDEVRSYLVIGAPGTGKTTAIRHLAHKLDRRTLRLPLKELCDEDGPRPSYAPGVREEVVPFRALVDVLAPDVLVIDDIDKAPESIQNTLLTFMEEARLRVQVLLASANRVDLLTPSMQRPERFDEHIPVPMLLPETLREILGAEAEVATRMSGWPITYVLDYLKRVKHLGRERARGEIEGLQRRVEQAEKVDTEQELVRMLNHRRR